MEDRVVRRAELEGMVGLCERQIRTLESEGKFPKRFALVPGGNAIGWSLLEVQAWLKARREAREQSIAVERGRLGRQIAVERGRQSDQPDPAD